MNTRPTYHARDLVPNAVNDFNYHQHERDVWRSQNGINVTPLPPNFDVRTMILPTAVASIRKAFTTAKTSHANWKRATREGKVDMRTAIKARPTGGLNVFRQKRAISLTQVRAYVLIDDSGSMRSSDAVVANPANPKAKVLVHRYAAAALFGATVATALGNVPTITLDVFYHAASGARLFLKWKWHRGTPVAVFNGSTTGSTVSGGSNADGHAIFALTNRLLKEIKRGEAGVIMVVSDGLPASSPGGNPGQALIDAVANARRHGITVIGVAIDGSDQRAFYGDDTLAFTGDWTKVGGDLARIIGGAMADHN